MTVFATKYRKKVRAGLHFHVQKRHAASENFFAADAEASVRISSRGKRENMAQTNSIASFDRFVDICPDPVIGVNDKGIINCFNAAAERLLDYRRTEAIGRLHIEVLYSPPSEARRIGKLLKASANGQIEGVETALRARDGRRIEIRLSATLLHAGETIVGSIGFFHDLSERKAMEAALRQASISDALTGLYNQRHFHHSLDEEVIRASRYQRPLTLMYIDLDHFKAVNDCLGHQEGDTVLRTIGSMISHTKRASDLAFRYGGDEFVLLLPETGISAALPLAERLCLACATCWPAAWATLYPHLPRVSMSIGIAQWESGEDAQKLVQRADIAMYEAKRGGGNRIAIAPPYETST